MGPLTFLNGAFLTALAAAALPILIHLFSRRRAREAPFSHLDFLDEITRRKIRRMKLRQWLLLALRTLAVACAALALSQPVWHGPGARSQRGSSTVAILLDDSFSLEAQIDPATVLPVDAGRSSLDMPTRFEEARQRALQVVDLLEQGDRAVLVFAASPVRIPYQSAVRDPALLREELLRAQPRPSRADLAGALERVAPILSAATTLNREIFVVSDFQRNQALEILQARGHAVQPAREEGGVPDAPAEGDLAPDFADTSSAAPEEEPAPLIRIPEQSRLYLLPVSAGASENAALVSAYFERDPSDAGGRLTLRARNLGAEPIEQRIVQVLADSPAGTPLAESFLTIEPHGSAQVVIAIPERPPSGRLVVRSGPDLLERDNVRYLTTATSSRFRVMLVTGGPLTDPEVREEARYLMLALDPVGAIAVLTGSRGPDPRRRSASDPSAGVFELRTVTEANLGLQSRIDADVVILLNVGRLSAAAAELLEHFRSEGGGVLIALGDRVDPRTYNTQILPRLGEVRLGNVRGELGSTTHFTLRPAVVGHDLFAGFPMAPGQALTSARFQRHLIARLGPQSRVLAEFSGGEPALIEEPGLLLFTSALDMRWSDFPTSASYLPFLHRALLELIFGGRVSRHDPLVGEPLSWPLPHDVGREAYRCVGPGEIEVSVAVSETDRGPFLTSDPAHEPGFYELVHDTADGRETFAVNVDTRESDLRSMSPAEGALIFGGAAVRLEPSQEISRRVLEARYGRELWRLFLVLAFCLLIAESLIARGRVVV